MVIEATLTKRWSVPTKRVAEFGSDLEALVEVLEQEQDVEPEVVIVTRPDPACS